MLRRAFRNKLANSVEQQSRWIKYVPGGNTNEVGVVDPEPHALGDYYKYIYANNVDPELLGGLNKAYPDSYEAAPMYEWDNWTFEYYGQWWDHGNPFFNSMILVYPVILLVCLIMTQVRLILRLEINLLDQIETKRSYELA